MSALFLILAFLLLFFLFKITGETKEWRHSILLSSIAWSVFLVVTTEGLSLFGALSKGPLLILWIILDISLIAFLAPHWNAIKDNLRPAPLSLDGVEWIMIAGGALLLAVTLTVALWAPPNSWDAMTYHMPRVMHWIQNQSVAFYPTHNIRQIYMPPFSEYVILNSQIATDGDRLANLPQFFSMAGSAVAVSLVAKIFGASRQGQLLAAIFALTIPNGILEASGAKNDYVLSFWVVSFAYFGLRWKEQPSSSSRATTAGLSLGLALFTKGTAYVLALPFIVWFGIVGVSALGAKVWRPVLIVALLSISLNTPQYLRNMEVFDHPLGTMAEEYEHLKPTNDIFTPAAFASNLIRNAALHLWTISSATNAMILDAITWLHDHVLGIDVNDRGTTWIMKFHVSVQHFIHLHENQTGNTFHFILLILTPLLLFQKKELQSDLPLKPLLNYVAACMMSLFLLFLIFKWVPQNIRYHLPIFLLLAPCIGLLITKRVSHKLIPVGVALALLIQSAPPALMNRSRPLTPITESMWHLIKGFTPAASVNNYNEFVLVHATRDKLLFSDYGTPYRPYLSTVAFIKTTACKDFGLLADLDNDPSGQWAMEYQLWSLLENAFHDGFRLRHVNIINRSKTLTPVAPFAPCLIIKLVEPSASLSGKPYVPFSQSLVSVDDVPYNLSFFAKFVAVYLPEKTDDVNK